MLETPEGSVPALLAGQGGFNGPFRGETQAHRCGFANRGSQGSVLGSTVSPEHRAEDTGWPVLLAMCPVFLVTLRALAVPKLSGERQTGKRGFLVL